MMGTRHPIVRSPARASDPNSELAALTTFSTTLAAGGSFRAACARALARAAGDFAWHAASVHLVRPDGVIGEAANTGAFLDAAARLARLHRAASTRAPVFGVQQDGSRRRRAVAIPLQAAGRTVGILDIVWDAGEGLPSQQFPFIEALATQLAAWVDRARLTDELEARLSETMSIRQQLEAYARDVRETFAAEKERAEQLADAFAELEQTYLATVQGLAVAVEAKDATTGGHLVRVAQLGRVLVRVLAPSLADDEQLRYGFLLHDIGKLTVPDAILRKQGPLSDAEWEIMRRHPAEGRRILEGIPFLEQARTIVYAHHERWDGQGYPLGLRGDEIPFGARIFPVADAFDAMTSERPYRPAMTIEQAFAETRCAAGTQFWADAVEALLEIPADELATIIGQGAEHA